MRSLLLIIVLCAASASHAFAQQPPVRHEPGNTSTPVAEAPGGTAVPAGAAARVDRIMAAYHGDSTPGGVVAVVRDGRMVFARGYGMANLEYGAPNTPSTVFHLASVSKQFTAFAIVLLAEQRKLSLDDDVRTHIPELADFGTTITLRHLLNHTSGLRDQWSLWVMSGGRMDDVIRQGDLLRLIERQRELNFTPGSEYLYSNSGYTLLAEVVRRVSGQPFGAWMQEHVFKPLEMSSTQIYDDHQRMVPRRSYSYDGVPQGFRKSVLSYANAGATSLFSTAEDLSKWLRNFHTAQLGGVGARQRMEERGVLTNGDTIPYALGINVTMHRGLRRIQHGGADAGYRTSLTYYPGIDAGVIVLGNLASFNPGQVANDVAEVFFGEHMTAPAPAPTRGRRPVRVSPRVLDRYVGWFAIDQGPLIRFTREGDRLIAHLQPLPGIALVALADTLFEVEAQGISARFAFHPEQQGDVSRGTLSQGAAMRMQRVEPWDPTRAELSAYEGPYYSRELETIYTLVLKDGRLMARHRRHGDIMLTPRTVDTFAGSEWFLGDIRIERDGAGAITGMRISNGRVRNLLLVKQGSGEALR